MGDSAEADRGRQVATVLVALGRDRAARMLSRFEPEELARLHAISGSSRGKEMETISIGELDGVAQAFETAFERGSGVLGAQSAFAALLAETAADAEEPASEESPEDIARGRRWDAVGKMSDEQLTTRLAEEDERVAALVVSRLGADRSVSLLDTMDDSLTEPLFRALPTFEVDADTEDLVLDALEDAAGDDGGKASNAKRCATLVAVLNALEPERSQAMQIVLRETMDPEDWKEVEAGIFHFDDLLSLDEASRTTVVADFQTDQLVLALRGTADDLRASVLEVLGPRLRRMVESELELVSASPGQAGEAARRAIAARAIALIKDGTIERDAAQA